VKYISIPILLIAFAAMLYMSTGQVMVSAIDIAEAQQEAVARISSSKLTQVIITANDLSTGKAVMIGKHEISYDGKLYDIASQTKEGNNTVLMVKWDEKEEGLISELAEHIENLFDNLPVNGKSTKHLLKNIDKDYFLSHRTTMSFLNESKTIEANSASAFAPYSSVSIEIHSPPPQA
jgi:hypothetical protein